MRCEETTRLAEGGRTWVGAGVGAADAAGGAADCWGGAGATAGSGSGLVARRRPSASALRRTRSAWASSIDDEWLFTPMPSEIERSSASLLVSPSSLASSYTRIFFGNLSLVVLRQRAATRDHLVSHTDSWHQPASRVPAVGSRR